MNTTKKQPDLNIHVIVPDGRSERIGARIGAGFKHREKDGYTIILNAQPIPLDGEIKLVAFPPKEK